MANQNLPVFDTLDLKDRIIKVRDNVNLVKQEKENLLTLVQAKERHLVQLRQEYTVLAPEEDLRWTEFEETTGSTTGGSVNGGSMAPPSIDQKRLQVMNDKLEMQILTHEIRQVLPSMEQEAKQWEAIARQQQKKLPKSYTLKPGNNSNDTVALLKSLQELEDSNQALLNQILKLKTDKNQAIEKEGSYNQTFFQEISTLRKVQHTLAMERQSLKIMNQKLRNQHQVEEHRYKMATTEFLQCRDRLKTFHNGYGWQTEVFKSEAGSAEKRVQVRRIPTILGNWIRSAVDPFKQATTKKGQEGEETQPAVSLQLVKRLLVEIYEEDLEEVFQRQSLMGSSSVLPDDAQQQQTMTAVSSNLSDDSFFRRQSVIAEHQLQIDMEKAAENSANKPMDTHNEDEEEELIVLPKSNSQKQMNPKSSMSTLNVSSSHASLRSRAESLVETATDIDLKTFCLLCDRLVILLEQ